MKEIFQNRKTLSIMALIFISGVLLHFSRSETVLNTVTNEVELTVKQQSIQPTPKKTPTIHNPDYCIVYTEETVKLKENIEMTLHYLQKTYKSFDADLGKVDLYNCPNLLLASPYLNHIGTVEEIELFVADGGNLFLMQTLEPNSHFNSLYRHFGIIEYYDFTNTSKIVMMSNVLIGAKQQTFWESDLLDSSLNITIEKSIQPDIVNQNNIPLLWKSDYGEGSFIILNCNMATEKYSRGLIAGMLSLQDEPFIYPIFNAKTFFIDDFPAPIAKERNDIIYKEFKQDLPSFYRNIWWPNMIRAANKYNIVYTGALIESYENNVTPPFDNSSDIELTFLIGFGRELINGGGELGYHGYNHQSLTMDESISNFFGYHSWKSIEHMKKSLLELKSYTSKAFPKYTVTTYVPPSNVLSQDGRSVLKDTLPELLTISSLYSEDLTQHAYVQEFEVAQDSIVEMPRISSGYFPSVSSKWEIANAITSHGYFSHFIHPDDVISEDRSKGGWTNMYEEFQQFIGDVHTRYPWLEALTATDSALKVANTLNSATQFEQTDQKITGTIEHFNKKLEFFLRTEKKVKQVKNCSYEEIDENTYIIYAHQANFEILFK
ncbi:DUF2194 domain-containing protein [Solibacillus isronensis]|uniref:DUF2194 domain-containing protein n=1 Tax=Solibacillus isronensis TaxID=412383 RepID=UPI0009A5D216|nr:DUF2194 domain-containing protein [Solibacillus isronensis]